MFGRILVVVLGIAVLGSLILLDQYMIDILGSGWLFGLYFLLSIGILFYVASLSRKR